MQYPCGKSCQEKHPGCKTECLMLKIYQEQQKEIKEARRRENILNSYIAKEKRKKTRVRRTIWRSSK